MQPYTCAADLSFWCKVKTPAIKNPTAVEFFSLVQINLGTRSYYIPAKENISHFLPRVDLLFKCSICPLNNSSGQACLYQKTLVVSGRRNFTFDTCKVKQCRSLFTMASSIDKTSLSIFQSFTIFQNQRWKTIKEPQAKEER